jgi:hypothetical protein
MCGLQSGLFFMRLYLFLCLLFLAPDSFAYSTLSCGSAIGSLRASSLDAECKIVCDSSNYSVTDIQENGTEATCVCSTGSVSIGCISNTCTPAASEIVDSSIPSGSGYCDPATDCQTVSYNYYLNGKLHSGGVATNGLSCFPPTANTSSVPSDTTCPSGYSLVSGTNGCECRNGSSYTESSTASTSSVCTGGSPTAPVLSPVSPVSSTVSGGNPSCPSGSVQIPSGSSISCYVLVNPSGGAGGSTSPASSSGATSSSGSSSRSTGSGATSGTGSSASSTVSTGSATSPTVSTASHGTFTAPAVSFGSSGLTSALHGMQSTEAFGSIGFGSSWLPQSCIAAPTWHVQLPFAGFNQSFTLPTDDLCALASDLRPFVLAGGVVLALLILAW